MQAIVDKFVDFKNRIVDFASDSSTSSVEELATEAATLREVYERFDLMMRKQFRSQLYRRTGKYGHNIVDFVLQSDMIDITALAAAVQETTNQLETA